MKKKEEKYIDGLVSIITPLYNSERFIEETIKSVKSQTYSNWELILIDDCSIDSSKDIIEKYKDYDKRIIYIKLDTNSGVSTARNVGIEKAKGRYIAFLDSDDIWKRNKLEEQIRFMSENKYYFTFTSYDIIDEFGRIINNEVKCKKMLDYRKALKGNNIGCLTVIIDRKYIDDIKFECIKHEDYLLWLKIIEKGFEAYGLEKTLSSYRRVGNSLSSNKFKSAIWTWKIYKDYLDFNILVSSYYFIYYIVNAIKKILISKYKRKMVFYGKN